MPVCRGISSIHGFLQFLEHDLGIAENAIERCHLLMGVVGLHHVLVAAIARVLTYLNDLTDVPNENVYRVTPLAFLPGHIHLINSTYSRID